MHCVIIGFALFDKLEKCLFEYSDIKGDPIEIPAKNINQYMTDGSSMFIEKRRSPIQNNTPVISKCNISYDAGNLILNDDEKQEMLNAHPRAMKYIRFPLGSREFINNLSRWCLWLVDANPTELRSIYPIRERVERVQQVRQVSSRASKHEAAATPVLFGEIRQPKNNYLAIPEVSSEGR